MSIEADNTSRSPEISGVIGSIARLCSPELIYLYNQKKNPKNELSSFKLCVVAGITDKYACERDIYLESDSDVPFDILIYTPEEWAQLSNKEGSFANRISETGVVVYNG